MKTTNKRNLRGKIIASTLILSMSFSYATAFADNGNGKGKEKDNKEKAHKVVEIKKDKDWKIDKVVPKDKVDKDVNKILKQIEGIKESDDNKEVNIFVEPSNDGSKGDQAVENADDTEDLAEKDENDDREYTILLEDDTTIELDQDRNKLQRELQKNIEKRDKVLGKILTSKKGLESKGFFGQLLRYTGIITRIEAQLGNTELENEIEKEASNENIITEVEDTDTSDEEVIAEAEEEQEMEEESDEESISEEGEVVSKEEAARIAEEIKEETNNLKKQIDEFKDRILALLSRLFNTDVTESDKANETLTQDSSEEDDEQIIFEVTE